MFLRDPCPVEARVADVVAHAAAGSPEAAASDSVRNDSFPVSRGMTAPPAVLFDETPDLAAPYLSRRELSAAPVAAWMSDFPFLRALIDALEVEGGADARWLEFERERTATRESPSPASEQGAKPTLKDVLVPEVPAHAVSLQQAASLIEALAAERSVLLLGPPGIGKSAIIAAAAARVGLPLRTLYGTQIAPEDVTGVPRLVGERTVFHPPRVLLPEPPTPFALFLDELPSATPDVQRALYPVLLERRVGEFSLAPGTWVVAAGNRAEDRALVRSLSSALLNRLLVVHVRISVDEWLVWAREGGVREDVCEFVEAFPEALLRLPDATPAPFSSPRSWATLSRAMDETLRHGLDLEWTLPVLARGTLTASDAERFVAARPHAMSRDRLREMLNREPDALLGLPLAVRLLFGRAIGSFAARDVAFLEQLDVGTILDVISIDGELLYAVLAPDPSRWVRAGGGGAIRSMIERALPPRGSHP